MSGELFGVFDFDLWGYTAYGYALAVLFLGCWRRAGSSTRPSGWRCAASAKTSSACRRSARLPAAPAEDLHDRGGMAGVAGALLTQTTDTVSLDTLSFQRSADVLVMLILGGTGRLYGGIVGAIVFLVARDRLAGMNPQYWYFWIGLILMLVVLFMPTRRPRRTGASGAGDGDERHERSRRCAPAA